MYNVGHRNMFKCNIVKLLHRFKSNLVVRWKYFSLLKSTARIDPFNPNQH